MKFNEHSELNGLHAFLSPSSYHWVNYTQDKLIERYKTYRATEEGTELHDLASRLINKKIRTADRKQAFNMFVNDSIGFRMESEKVLFYSEVCFGTADAISFRDNVLRIFDLKTGKIKASYTQLDVYAALFCLEYSVSPFEIEIEERIYQGAGYTINIPPAEHIRHIMDKIIEHDVVLSKLRAEEV